MKLGRATIASTVDAPVRRTESRFVVQEHRARKHHFDFQLERDGVLKSWALPRGLPENPGMRRLAIAVEDHPLSWASFEGIIPEGNYGAGTVTIWDRGEYHVHRWSPAKIEFSLAGNARRVGVRGGLFRFWTLPQKVAVKPWTHHPVIQFIPIHLQSQATEDRIHRIGRIEALASGRSATDPVECGGVPTGLQVGFSRRFRRTGEKTNWRMPRRGMNQPSWVWGA